MSPARRLQFLVASVVVVLIVWIAGAAVLYWRITTQVTAGGRVLARHEWPESLVDLLKEAGKRQIHVVDLNVYSGPHDDYFWRCEGTPALLDLMIARWDLLPVKSDNRLVRLVLDYMPAALSWVSQGEDVDYYVSSQCVPGGEWKGHQYCVVNDKTNGVIVVGYYYNF